MRRWWSVMLGHVLERRRRAEVQDDVDRARERREEIEARAERVDRTTKSLDASVEVLRHEWRSA
jgi:hypothetical protein